MMFFYVTDPIKTKMMNKNSINRHFGPKIGPQLKMVIILKFNETNLSFVENRLSVTFKCKRKLFTICFDRTWNYNTNRNNM